MYNLPHCKRPCANCPFRKDAPAGWLGADRMREILAAPLFTCHKTNAPNRLQCAGHMLVKGPANDFVSLANQLRIQLNLSGSELVFEQEEDLITHHTF